MKMKEIQQTAMEAKAMIKAMLDQAEEANNEMIQELGITREFCESIASDLDQTIIDDMSISDVDVLLKTFDIDDVKIRQKFSQDDSGLSTIEKWRALFTNIKNSFTATKESILQSQEMDQVIHEMYQKQVEFLESDEYKEQQAARIREMKEAVEVEVDEAKKKDYIRRLTALERSENLSFLLDRFNQYGAAEAERHIRTFFDATRGNKLLERYHKNLDKMGVSRQIHVAYHNIEENFLPENYAPFNNVFLFVVMSYVAYANVNDDIERLYVSSVFHALNLLVTGRIGEGKKTSLLRLVRTIDNYFMAKDSNMELFKEKNTLWKEHPVRIEMERTIALKNLRVEAVELIGKLDGEIEVDGKIITAAILLDMELEDLQAMKEILAERVKEKEEEEAALKASYVEEEDDPEEDDELDFNVGLEGDMISIAGLPPTPVTGLLYTEHPEDFTSPVEEEPEEIVPEREVVEMDDLAPTDLD